MEAYATYSPDDNKLRLYPGEERLDADTFAKVKNAGFRWAPRQKLFVAPAWSPSREDLLIELCGEVGDEDTSLTERAEERAERFEGYSEKRAADAVAAKEAADTLANGIPLGQPILVGHHSERRARKDADRIESNMRRAVKMWRTSQYWQERAAGALFHAKYKEVPAVRARRIKGIEKELRGMDKADAEARRRLDFWQRDDLTREAAISFANYNHLGLAKREGETYGRSLYDALSRDGMATQEAAEIAIGVYTRYLNSAYRARWREHYNNRLAYERAMLNEQGATTADSHDFEPGGRVLIGKDWYTIARVNKFEGRAVSLSLAGVSGYRRKAELAHVLSYEPPTAESKAIAKKATTQPPLCNYPGEGFAHITKAEWDRLKGGWTGNTRLSYMKPTEKHAGHRVRQVSARFVEENAKGWESRWVYITDQKRVDPPAASMATPPEPTHSVPVPRPTTEHVYADPAPRIGAKDPDEAWKKAEELRGQLDLFKQNGGLRVEVVGTPSFFPTPEALAARMAELADIEPGSRILEPSAGSGRLIDAAMADQPTCSIVAIEQAVKLASHLRGRYQPPVSVKVYEADFMTCTRNGGNPHQLGQFDRVLMNPPFENGQDIDHVRHAYGMLAPGGVLVAVMCAGPFFRSDRKSTEFREWLEEIGGDVEDLPADTFKESGTSVNTKLVRLTA